MSALGIPVNIEKSEISSTLNAFILLTFLMGMYTIIYFGTIYTYFTKNPSQRLLVPAAITLLYLSNITGTAFQWYAMKWEFVNNGDTRDSTYIALLDNPRWLNLASDISFYVVFVIADGLLIWRCFFVWDRSLRIILVSLVFLVAEIALYLAQIAFNARLNDFIVSAALSATINHLLAAAYFMSFATTLVTTVLIAYRIYPVSKQPGTSSRRLKHVIDIVVQSGVIYALSQLTIAIAGVVSRPNTFPSTRIVAFQAYAENLNVAFAGMSATVMVARVALLFNDTSYPATSVHLSGLQFHARSTHPTVNMEAMEITDSDGNRNSAGDQQAIGEKAQSNV